MNYDVHIVGAGVSGGVAGYHLAKKGLDTVITEEDAEIGIPQHCTGIISVKGLEESGFSYKKCIINKLYGVHIHGPYGETLTIRKKSVQAYIVDRAELDRLYVGMAEKAGAHIITGRKVKAREDYLGKIIIGADGANSTVAQIERFEPIKKYAFGYQELVRSKDIINEGMVSVYLSQKAFPGFFGWVAPLDDGIALCGFGVSGGHLVTGRMRALFSMARIRPQKILKRLGGVMPFGTRKCNAKNNVILIGGAGGFSKATSGGGVYFSTISAKVAAECIAKNKIDEFDRSMEKHIKELKKHEYIRYLYNLSADIMIEMLIRAGKPLGIAKYIEEKGDMDYISSIIP
ncbi:MAG: NAD(P)/FAD-dependent oxidoreductase [Candidatus Micrarchaeota archaeon]|nr:NAD(P)/FAD-dependent oxidoreductase [Candidatus Micrarchaeota archaeon]